MSKQEHSERDYHAEQVAKNFATYSDWCTYRDFYGDSYISPERYHRAKLKIKKSAE